jgi:hypothetical protein
MYCFKWWFRIHIIISIDIGSCLTSNVKNTLEYPHTQVYSGHYKPYSITPIQENENFTFYRGREISELRLLWLRIVKLTSYKPTLSECQLGTN